MSSKEIIDLYFMDARSKLVDMAAFLDRIDRSEGGDDYRVDSLKAAARELLSPEEGRARRVLEVLSDPTQEPISVAGEKGASGAWPGFGGSE